MLTVRKDKISLPVAGAPIGPSWSGGRWRANHPRALAAPRTTVPAPSVEPV